jgi:GMC oxidoreductase/FAD binding domain
MNSSPDDPGAGTADITVIGAGPAGITLALECARNGKSVLLLESGAKAHRRKAQHLSTADIVDKRTHYDMALSVARRLGGTSNLWGGRCQPLDPIDFTERDGLVGAHWPIGLADLLPFYDPACNYASCGRPIFTSSIVGPDHDEPVDMHRLERFSRIPRFQNAHRHALSSAKMQIHLNSTVADLVLDERGFVKEIVVVGKSGKRTVMAVKDVVIACGGLESTRMLLALQRKHPDLFGGKEGPLGRYYMGHLVGEIADVTFASDAIARSFDFFLDGHGSYVRRRMIFSDNVQRSNRLLNCSFWPVVPTISNAAHRSGPLSLAYLAITQIALSRLLVAEAVRMRHFKPEAALLPHVRNIMKDFPNTAAYLPLFIYKKYFARIRLPGLFVLNSGRRFGLSFHQEQIPDPNSRVWLNNNVDKTGVPQLSIDLKFDRRNAEALVRSHRLLKTWLEKNRIGSLHYRHPEPELEDAVLAQASHGRHQIGTARMGSHRKLAVVDANLRAFDVPNLHVLSSAVMPTSGQAGPTLTIIALAARLANHLKGARV